MTKDVQNKSYKIVSAHPLFFTPILTFQVSEHELLNAQLVELAQRLRATSAGLTHSVSTKLGWHSDTDLFRSDDPAIVRLRTIALGSVVDAAKHVWPEAEVDQLKIEFTAWMNINPTNAYNSVHEHPNFHWAGVYYVKAQQSELPRDGILEFLDPRTNVNATSLPQMQFSSRYRIKPEEGRLHIFPAFLSHSVTPNLSSEDRISIAFNARFVGNAGDKNRDAISVMDLMSATR